MPPYYVLNTIVWTDMCFSCLFTLPAACLHNVALLVATTYTQQAELVYNEIEFESIVVVFASTAIEYVNRELGTL